MRPSKDVNNAEVSHSGEEPDNEFSHPADSRVNNTRVSHSGEEPDNEFSHPTDSRSLADKGTVKSPMRYSLSQPTTTLTC